MDTESQKIIDAVNQALDQANARVDTRTEGIQEVLGTLIGEIECLTRRVGELALDVSGLESRERIRSNDELDKMIESGKFEIPDASRIFLMVSIFLAGLATGALF